jgi:hypothetical protein
LNEVNHFVDSAKSVVCGMQVELLVEVKETEVRAVMHKMGMRYKKVVHIPLQANSELNLVLRQQWALRYLELLQNDKVILSIDETWVSGLFGIIQLCILF